MANASVLGALKVILGADTSDLNKGLAGAGASVDRFASGAAKALAGLAAGATAMLAGVGFAVRRSIDDADKLGKMAQKIGIPVEELSRLRLAANLADVDLEALGTSVGKLSKNMVEAAAKPTSEAANAFRALGVEVKNSDGTLRSSTAVMADIASKFETMKDGAGKTAVAMALFGKTGKDMIPLLNAGRDGLTEAAREAEQFGIVIDSKTAKSAEAFNDNLTRLNAAKDGFILKITAGMLPAMEKLSAAFVQNAKDASLTDNVSKALSVALQSLATMAQVVATAFNQMWIVVGGFFAGLGNIMRLEASGLAETMAKMSRDSTASFANMAQVIKTIWGGAVADIQVWAGDGLGVATKAQKEFNYTALAGKNAIDQFLDSQTKRVAGLAAETQAFGLNAGAKERLQLVEQTLATAQANGLTLTEAQRAKMVELGFAVEQYSLKLAGAHLVQSAMEPHEAYRAELEKNRLALAAFGATAEQIERVNQKTADRYGASWEAQAATSAQAFSTISQAFGKENKAMATAGKAFGIASALINAYVGASKALATIPPPAGYLAAAASLAQGLSYVASIKSVGGFSTGGRFRIPGGTGGGDRVHAAFEPGEIVDVWRPNETHRMAGDPRGGGSREVNISVQGDIFSRETIRGLIEQLNAAFADGHRLNLRPT